MPILDIQKRARELGRIRTGSKAANGAPTKLSKFRITSASKPLLEKVAALYGGDVVEWTPAGGAQQWEVYTNVARIPIYVPPQPVTQWYEAWTAGGCVHRCDGETDYITGEACDSYNEDSLHHQSKPTTRLNVVLCEVEGIGFFRLESHGWNAAVELPQAAEFLAQANGYVEGWLALEERVSKTIKDGKPQTRRFLVPIIEIGVTPAQLMAGQGRVGTPEVEGPVAHAAIEAPQTTAPAAAPLPTIDDIEAARCPEVVYSIFTYLTEHQAMTPELDAACKARVAALQAAADPDGAVEAEVVDDGDADAVWQQVVTEAGRRGMTLPQVTEDYKVFSGGLAASTASAAELAAYLEHLAAQVSA